MGGKYYVDSDGYPRVELPPEWEHYAEWNAYLSRQWSDLGYNITEKKEPLGEEPACKNEPKTEEDILTWDAQA